MSPKARFDPQEVADALDAENWRKQNNKTLVDGYEYFLELGRQRGKSYAGRTLNSWASKVLRILRGGEVLRKATEPSELLQTVRGLLDRGPRTVGDDILRD